MIDKGRVFLTHCEVCAWLNRFFTVILEVIRHLYESGVLHIDEGAYFVSFFTFSCIPIYFQDVRRILLTMSLFSSMDFTRKLQITSAT